MKRGIATFTLDYGTCPPWLFERMVKLGREMVRVLIEEYGPDEFIKRIGDPVWFQSLGTVLAFDWNASGLTTILTAALKEAIREREEEFGIFICGGKGKTSRKTPDQITAWGERISLPSEATSNLVYNSRMSAKVDSALVQDGFQIYHHAFFFSKNGAWSVVQQGMNISEKTARRYHWFSEDVKDLVQEPHSGIASQDLSRARLTLNMSAHESKKNQDMSVEMVNGSSSGKTILKDLRILQKHSSELSQMLKVRFKNQLRDEQKVDELTLLQLSDKEFSTHKVMLEHFAESKYLKKIFAKLGDEKPRTYESLLATRGVGPTTIRALALVGEVIYGAQASYEDPARYSFAHGGKDAIPYPVDRPTYDQTIETLRKVVKKTSLQSSEKRTILDKLNKAS